MGYSYVSQSPWGGKCCAYSLADVNVLMRVGQQACARVAGEHLNFVAVAAAAEQEATVGRNAELARMSSCRLVSDAGEQSRVGIYGEDGYAFVAQAIAGV